MRKKFKSERGQTIQVDGPRDNAGDSSVKDARYTTGGSVTNLDHSLKSDNARVDGTGHNKKNRFD